MNKVGSDTAKQHRAQAASLELAAQRADRRGYYSFAWSWRAEARKHRERAAVLERENQATA